MLNSAMFHTHGTVWLKCLLKNRFVSSSSNSFLQFSDNASNVKYCSLRALTYVLEAFVYLAS